MSSAGFAVGPFGAVVGKLFGAAEHDDDSLRDHLDGLVAGTKYPGLRAVRLGHLAKVKLRDLDEWQGLDPVKNFSQEADFSDRIHGLFQGKDTGLTMLEVAESVEAWLKPYDRGD